MLSVAEDRSHRFPSIATQQLPLPSQMVATRHGDQDVQANGMASLSHQSNPPFSHRYVRIYMTHERQDIMIREKTGGKSGT